MKKSSIFSILIWTLVLIPLYGDVNYQKFRSLEEVIKYETSLIERVSSYDTEKLSDAYASRGESFLICGDLKNALEDFQASYELAILSKDSDVATGLVFRALFGQALLYGYLDMPEKVYLIGRTLLDIIYSNSCDESLELSFQEFPLDITHYIQKCEDVPIFGPDRVSIDDCIDRVNNTEAFCYILICKAPGRVQSLLTFIVNQLSREARNCCSAGGIWKGCLQKLANKYHQWNQKWLKLGIPPDPAWD